MNNDGYSNWWWYNKDNPNKCQWKKIKYICKNYKANNDGYDGGKININNNDNNIKMKDSGKKVTNKIIIVMTVTWWLFYEDGGDTEFIMKP